jgi:hypothetical protein
MPLRFAGTLRTHHSNPRYFTDDTGRAIYLTGSHTWASVQEVGLQGAPPFPFHEFLQFVSKSGHNFMRLWMWEQPERASWTEERIVFHPLPWARTGPGLAFDGKPKFDLDTWDPEYFERLRQRCIAAGTRGIYVSVMLFQGWSLPKLPNNSGDPFPFHPFNAENNINGVDIPYSGCDDDENPSLHSTFNPLALEKQVALVRQMVDTINDLDHVLYEVINEGGSTTWQYHMVNVVHDYERTMPKQHPVGMTHRLRPNQLNAKLFESSADWVSPINEPNERHYPGFASLQDYQNDPPVADGRKVVILDTDHLWGHGGTAEWVWKSFTRGYNPIFMDPWWPCYINSDPEVTPWAFVDGISKDQRDYPDWGPTRRAMGDTLRFARRMNLSAMIPRPDLASTRYCLANPGHEYLVYLPHGGRVTLNLCHGSGPFTPEWFIPRTSQTLPGTAIPSGTDYAVATAPFSGDAVLYVT